MNPSLAERRDPGARPGRCCCESGSRRRGDLHLAERQVPSRRRDGPRVDEERSIERPTEACHRYSAPSSRVFSSRKRDSRYPRRSRWPPSVGCR